MARSCSKLSGVCEIWNHEAIRWMGGVKGTNVVWRCGKKLPVNVLKQAHYLSCVSPMYTGTLEGLMEWSGCGPLAHVQLVGGMSHIGLM